MTCYVEVPWQAMAVAAAKSLQTQACCEMRCASPLGHGHLALFSGLLQPLHSSLHWTARVPPVLSETVGASQRAEDPCQTALACLAAAVVLVGRCIFAAAKWRDAHPQTEKCCECKECKDGAGNCLLAFALAHLALASRTTALALTAVAAVAHYVLAHQLASMRKLCQEHSAKRKSGSEVEHEKRQSGGAKAGSPWWVQALVHRKNCHLAVRMQTLGERVSQHSVIGMQTWPPCMAMQKMVQLARLG